ncbi:helix-turn-helix domain-containing protein [Streptomyces scabiei]|uniref:helix-turn-helix domain-containing protein n=1 Tax=Streptomyces scabiei TaxID=1930 RepID=UPI0029A7FC94|nr:helix-turn-helix domain-containing protein [Streptomyces scabiei]MDX2685122.1 helix-turn-helix domain-containing protein [Streptomyces scabiei]MDX2748968.1 helix-turn-helix domain-containing protein [Streptomyces scabiei]MDX2803143.1 helix-turn-helix domain-containing protein [Streptomyces scabiei]MDX3196729.1 helix-turn-helix domain-containing protein [Streptomyces scabiei]MDX3223593.1 helix-turn-helix domain-containing protein [Streptomyces scabiei]
MSYDAREWVWDHSHSKGTARMVLALIADRCRDRHCVAYASVPTLMKRANASRTAVRDALAKLIASGELVQVRNRKGPRGETYYLLPVAARFLADQAEEGDRNAAPRGDRIPTLGGPESDPAEHVEGEADSDPGERNPAPGGYGIRPGGGADSVPQNRREPKVNGKSSSSSAPLISALEWQIDDDARAWLQRHGHLDRLGEHALHSADEKWRAYRTPWAPRTSAAWATDWRAWIAREHTPAPGRPTLYALPGGTHGTHTTATGMTRSEAHMAALLAALDEPTGTE